MGIEELFNYTKYKFRKLKFHLLIMAFIIFLFATFYINDYNHIFTTSDDNFNDNYNTAKTPFFNDPVQNMTCPHYKIALFISSGMEQVDKRMLMREELFGITDNLIPCMKQDTTEIFYKFFLRKTKKLDKKILFSYKSEQMEYYHDIVEIDIQRDDDWHQSLLRYVSSNPQGYTVHMVISLTFFSFPLPCIFRL